MVFCKSCVYFRGRLGGIAVEPEQCRAELNTRVKTYRTYKEEWTECVYLDDPCIINKDNNCPWYVDRQVTIGKDE